MGLSGKVVHSSDWGTGLEVDYQFVRSLLLPSFLCPACRLQPCHLAVTHSCAATTAEGEAAECILTDAAAAAKVLVALRLSIYAGDISSP